MKAWTLSSRLLFSFFFLAGFVQNLAIADNDAGGRISFKNNPLQYTLQANEAFEVDLLSLVTDVPDEKLQWSTSNEKPNWLTLDSENSRLFGTPAGADSGTSTFRLGVQAGDAGAFAQVIITVMALPHWTDTPLDLGLQKEGQPYTFDLKTKVTDPQSGPLTFTAKNLPTWLTLTQTGLLSGTPQRKDVGEYQGIEFTVTALGGTATTHAYGEVLKTIHPPSWQDNPISLDDAFEDQPYSRDISEFVDNFEQSPLHFELVSSHAWLRMNPSGTLHGTPGKNDIGDTTVLVRFSTEVDGNSFDGTTRFELTTQHVNHPPAWVSHPIILPEAFTGIAYSQNLKGSATDPDAGDTLSFEIVSGPAWATLSADGAFSGTPANSDTGSNQWMVRVSDGEFSDETTLRVSVIKSNEPPFWLNKPTFLPSAKEDFNYHADLTRLVTDPDGDAITFTLIDGPVWANLTRTGALFGTPKAADVGLSKFRIKISDNISGSDLSEVILEVTHTNHPPQWSLNPIKFVVKEDQDFSRDISPFVTDSDGDTLSFNKISGANFAQISADGKLSGSPSSQHVGDNSFVIRVDDGQGKYANVSVIIQVLHVNHPPTWNQDPITLPNTKEGHSTTANLSGHASDPDNGDQLTFMKVTGPSWVYMSSNGVLSGTPAREHVGVNSIRVRVLDQDNEFATATVRITVEKVNIAPRWRQNPILMTDSFEDREFNFHLSRYAVDDDGDVLSFKKISGPAWMFVGSNGEIKGVPSKADLGDYVAEFEVTDGQATATATAQGTVIHTNHPPVIDSNALAFAIKERAVREIPLSEFVEDADGDHLNFVLFDSADWVTLSSDGQLVLSPEFKQIGDHAFRFRVDDSILFAEAVIQVHVERDPRAPVWLQNPIQTTARSNEKFDFSVADKVKDLDNIPITCRLKTNNSWLVADGSCNVMGIPRNEHLGDNAFEICAKNDVLESCATLLVNVIPGTHVDTIQVDSPIEGARAENLWVIDNSPKSHKLMRELKAHIHHYFNALKENNVESKGVYITADPEHDGEPVFDNQILLNGLGSNIITDFLNRMEIGYSSNCCHSPIWSTHLFYDQLPDIDDIYEKDYHLTGVPSDVMIITQQSDHFPSYTKGTELENYTTEDFVADFQDFHADKPYRVSVIAPKCPHLFKAANKPVAESVAYQTLAEKTGGTYYVSDCYEVEKPLKDYAQKVVFRSLVTGKHRIRLSKTPLETHSIKVTLAGKTLEGNTGSETDHWNYDATTKEIILHWGRIDISGLKAGDEIAIEYRVS